MKLFACNAILLMLILLTGLASPAQSQSPEPQWWKGNLHTHSLWSDGDEFPEMIAAWYAEHDYNFLALSDHNILSAGMRWMPLNKIVARSDAEILQRYQERFGSEWVETRTRPGPNAGEPDVQEVRLKPLDEFRCLVEQAGKFIMIQGEEISDSAEGKPVHMNATNVNQLILPVGGETVRDAMRNNLRLVLEQEAASGRELLPHLNHPNFGYAVTAEDLANVVQERFFEVYNGHPGVNQLGDAEHMAIEKMWDVANAIRLTQLDAEPLWGIATDDSHEYHGQPGSRPGRGWVMVRSRYLTPEHLIRAMKAADFYASSGVVVDQIEFTPDSGTLSLKIPPVDGVKFTTEFVATLQPLEEGQLPPIESIGVVVATVDGLNPKYQLQGNEVYVRARITSTAPHTDPSLPDQKQQAWTQPVLPKP
ncbi:MAG: hypothetical protein R3C53_08565 [Pirellulaceae bacterium]